jgi:hypothetical protein
VNLADDRGLGQEILGKRDAPPLETRAREPSPENPHPTFRFARPTLEDLFWTFAEV